MSTLAKLIFLSLLGFGLFVASGALANMVLVTTGCVWTSSGVFSISFASTAAAGLAILDDISSFLNWF